MTELSLNEIKKEWHGTYRAYLIGLLLSLVLTCISFGLVIYEPFSKDLIFHTILSLAVLQAIVQLRFFLHLGQEAKPRWETLIFTFTTLILLAVVIGSLWIMHDLDARMMNMEMPL